MGLKQGRFCPPGVVSGDIFVTTRGVCAAGTWLPPAPADQPARHRPAPPRKYPARGRWWGLSPPPPHGRQVFALLLCVCCSVSPAATAVTLPPSCAHLLAFFLELLAASFSVVPFALHILTILPQFFILSKTFCESPFLLAA